MRMYSATILCLCFCVFSESLGGFTVSNRFGLSTSEYARSGTSYTVDTNALAYDGIPAEHRSSRPRTCHCSQRTACPQMTGYHPPQSTCCQVQTSRRTMPPWPTHRTLLPSCTTCRTLPPCTTCRTLPSCTTCWTLPSCTTCRTLPPCTTCRTLPSCTTCRTLPSCTTCRTQPPCTRCRTPPPCTICRTLPSCTTCRTQPPCTRCRTLPPCTTCWTLNPCTTRRTLPPCIKCQTTRPYPSPMLVLHVELPERPCYTPMPSDTPPSRGDGGYGIAWSDNTTPSAIINNFHQFGTTRRPCRQPTKCPCTSMIPIMQPCNCKMHD
ncbi:Uncharacterized protein FWK35_00002582 [Aphis craccivora]|uniref:Uncharacterized protein n=1 Tax=Aphis craccivora TaxID=307492 RepID=A0A6G0ZK78_APHCR|nr:Uncharacterized protein FWK35_00002582 [Aphis craccivora]